MINLVPLHCILHSTLPTRGLCRKQNLDTTNVIKDKTFLMLYVLTILFHIVVVVFIYDLILQYFSLNGINYIYK